MIPVPSSVRVWLAVGRTDLRRGMNGLALQVQEVLHRDPHAGDLFVFRGAKGNLIKIIWHDGLGMSLYAKRLERGKFVWPSPTNGTIGISSAFAPSGDMNCCKRIAIASRGGSNHCFWTETGYRQQLAPRDDTGSRGCEAYVQWLVN